MTSMAIAVKGSKKSMVGKLFRSVVIVMIVSGLVEALASFTDGICVSRFINDNATAALGIVNPIIMFLSVFGVILQVGCEIFCSRSMASGKTKDVGRIFSITVISAVIVGMVFFFINIFASNQIALILGATRDEVRVHASDYLRGYFIGAPFVILHLILMPLAHLDGGKKITYTSVVVVLGINVITDIVVGSITHSTFAIGLATSLSYIAGTLVLLIHFLKKNCIFHFSFKGLKGSDLFEIIVNGLPNGVKTTIIFARSICVNRIILMIGGTVAMTAYSVQGHVSPFIESITSGLISASLMLSSIFYGEEDIDSLDELLHLLVKVTLTAVLGLSIVYFFIAPFIAQIYGVGTKDPEILKQAIIAMKADSITIPFVAINASFLAIFQGTKRRALSYICTVIQSFVLPIIFITALSFGLRKTEGIWYGMTCGFCSFIFIFLFICTIKNKKFPTTAREMFFLPKDFGYSEDQCLHLSINNIHDALNLSSQVLDFCTKHNIDNKRANHLAACVEEIGVMTVISGFTRANKNKFEKLNSKLNKTLKSIKNFFKKVFNTKFVQLIVKPFKMLFNTKLFVLIRKPFTKLHNYLTNKKNNKAKHHCEMRILYKNDNLVLRVRDDCAEFNIKEKADKFNQKDPTKNMAIRLIMGLAKNVEYSNILKTNNLILSI